MKSQLNNKVKAIALRKQGLSYAEILKQVPVSKSSLSGWFKLLELSPEEQNSLELRAEQNIGRGRERAALSNRKRRACRESLALEKAQNLFNTYKNETDFILGIGLYWAEGAKRTSLFQFINSDENMIIFVLYWVRRYLGIKNEQVRLRLISHEDFKNESYEEYWSELLAVPLSQFHKTSYKKNSHGVLKKNPNYRGCLRIEVGGGMELLRIMLSLQKILLENIRVV